MQLFVILLQISVLRMRKAIVLSRVSTMQQDLKQQTEERMMRGRRFNIAMGKSGGGRAPFGYTTDKDKRFVINPEQAAILKRIFTDYAYSGKSQVKISRELKEEGLFPNIRVQSLNNQINRWIKRSYYTGTTQFPQIIPKTLFCRDTKIVGSKYNSAYPQKGYFFNIKP